MRLRRAEVVAHPFRTEREKDEVPSTVWQWLERDSLGLLRYCRCGCAGNRQNRRTCAALLLSLRFDFAQQHGGSYRTDRNGARLSATLAIEHFALVAGGKD